jgi:hypothetical protein
MDCADHHLVAQHDFAGDVLDVLDISGGLGLRPGLILELLEIVAGTEGAPGPAQQDASSVRVVVGPGQRRL